MKLTGHNAINAAKRMLKAKNDAAVARRLQVAPPVISKIRHEKLPFGAVLMIRLHEELNGKPIKEIRAEMAAA